MNFYDFNDPCFFTGCGFDTPSNTGKDQMVSRPNLAGFKYCGHIDLDIDDPDPYTHAFWLAGCWLAAREFNTGSHRFPIYRRYMGARVSPDFSFSGCNFL